MKCIALCLAGVFAVFTLQGCGGDSGDVGNCSAADKTTLSKVDITQIETYVDLCTKNCAIAIPPLSDSCLDPCFAKALNIAETCGTCFGNLVQCGVECNVPGSPKDCSENCQAKLKDCGIGEDVTPERGNCSVPQGQNCETILSSYCGGGATSFCHMKAPEWPSCVGVVNDTCDASHEKCACPNKTTSIPVTV